MTGSVAAINCTNCGAGLEVLGGGRVRTQVCGYCGAALDANDDYAVLKVYADMDRPFTPFKLGMVGDVQGVPFTLIGILGQVERYAGEEWRWVDHMLYSPTHGYAWLTLEDGHTILTRKVRDWPGGSFLTAQAVERSNSRPRRFWRGQAYTYYSSSSWRTDFAEGEFNWRARVGERGTTVTLMPKGAASNKLAFVERPEGERELEVSTYFAEAPAAFGVETPPRPIGVHPLQPYSAAEGKGFYMAWFGGLAAVCAALALFVAFARPLQPIYDGPAGSVPAALNFEVSDLNRPVRVQLHHDLWQSWAEWDLRLSDPTGAPLAVTSRGISFYSGTSGGESWREGSRFSQITFMPSTAGTYTLGLALSASENATAVGRAALQVSVREGHMNALWISLAAAATALAFLWSASGRIRHRMKRWSGSDWSEDD